MTAKDVLKFNLRSVHDITKGWLSDFSDADLLVRPVPNANHAAWQLGHLMTGEQTFISALGHTMPDLPSGFAEAHSKEAATSNDPKKFCTKDEYLSLFGRLHDATAKAIDATPDADFDKPGPENMRSYAPTVMAVFALIPNHELMHSGSFVTIRRKLGKPVLF